MHGLTNLNKRQGFELRRLTVPAHGVEKEHVDAASAVRSLSSKKTNDIGVVCVCVCVCVFGLRFGVGKGVITRSLVKCGAVLVAGGCN